MVFAIRDPRALKWAHRFGITGLTTDLSFNDKFTALCRTTLQGDDAQKALIPTSILVAEILLKAVQMNGNVSIMKSFDKMQRDMDLLMDL